MIIGPEIERVASELSGEVAKAVHRLGARVADGAAEVLGRPRAKAPLAAPVSGRWAGPTAVAGHPGAEAVAGLPAELAHRLLGAVETALPAFPAAESVSGLGRLVRAGAAGDGMVAVGGREGHDAFAVAAQLARFRLPGAAEATAALVRALAISAPVAAVLDATIDGDAAVIAAEHGRRWFALSVAAATIVVRAGDDGGATPGGEAALVVGLGVDAAVQMLAERPMPAEWAAARAQEQRAEFLLPQMCSIMLRAQNRRFGLLEVGTAAVPDVPAGGVATAVDGGLVVHVGSDDVPVTVVVETTAHGPERDLRPPDHDDWEEIVELGFSAGGLAELVGKPMTVHPPQEVGFPWPATVRARVYAGGRGSGGAERYWIRLWEAPLAPVAVLRDRPVAPSLPAVVGTALIRTDFSDDDRWAAAVARLTTPNVSGFVADLGIVDDRRFADASIADLLALATPFWCGLHACFFVADRATLASAELPVLVVGLRGDDRGRSFRVIGDELWGVENNLALSNMDFVEFAAATEDGVFRGF